MTFIKKHDQISLCGLRSTNEDINKCILGIDSNDITIPRIDYYCILDGHGGIHVAQIVNKLLIKLLFNSTLIYPISNTKINKIYEYIQFILKKTTIANACGCTALVVIIYLDKKNNKCIQIINLGDCRAIISRNGLTIQLTKDHRPCNIDEIKRIKHVNSLLKYNETKRDIYLDRAGDWRVGDLSVSRAFGDLDNIPQITHIPDIFLYKLNNDDEFIVMGCDGLWDKLHSEEVINFIRINLKYPDTDMFNIYNKYPSNNLIKSENIDKKNINIAIRLAEYAIARGSEDNISVFIIYL